MISDGNQDGNGTEIDPLAHDPAKSPLWKVYFRRGHGEQQE